MSSSVDFGIWRESVARDDESCGSSWHSTISLPTVGREVDAFSFMFDGVPYIAVDTSKTAERVRFDIAHGMGI